MNITTLLKSFLVTVFLGYIPLYSMNVEPYQELRSHIENLIHNLPQKTEGITLTRGFLMGIQDLLASSKNSEDLKQILQQLEYIKAFTRDKEYKKEKIISPLYGELSLEQFGNMMLEELLKDIERVGKIARPAALRGFLNPSSKESGNRCFMNAALQSMYVLSHFNEALLKKEDTNYYKPLSIADLYIQFIRLITRSSEPYVDLLPLCLIGWKNLQRPSGSQQDAVEFIQMLLDCIITEDINREKTKDKEHLEVKSLFSIELHPQRIGHKFQPEEHLMLSLTIQDCNHLTDCLDTFFELEEVEYESETQPRVTVLHKTGHYFFIGLKRKVYDLTSKSYKRILRPISFPWQDLDLAKYSDKSMHFPLYRLKAILIHSGSAEGGHYTSYVLHNNQWYFCNDTQIKPIPIEEIKAIAKRGYGTDKEQLPVMLCYEAQS